MESGKNSVNKFIRTERKEDPEKMRLKSAITSHRKKVKSIMNSTNKDATTTRAATSYDHRVKGSYSTSNL